MSGTRVGASVLSQRHKHGIRGGGGHLHVRGIRALPAAQTWHMRRRRRRREREREREREKFIDNQIDD
jgi:hypothetical protein